MSLLLSNALANIFTTPKDEPQFRALCHTNGVHLPETLTSTVLDIHDTAIKILQRHEDIPTIFRAILEQKDTESILQLDVTKKMKSRYSAAHLAAIVGRIDLVYGLWLKGVALDEKTDNEKTVFDFLKLRGFTLASKECVPLFKNMVVPLSEVPLHIKRTYLTHNIYSANALLSVCFCDTSNFRKSPEIKESDAPIYVNQMQTEHPKLKGHLEVRASRTINAGEFIFLYNGYVQTTREKTPKYDHTYTLGFSKSTSIDSRAGSHAALINHSFPNCRWKESYFEGVAVRAIRKIEKDEPLYIDYGRGYFEKKLKPIELNKKELDAFFLGSNYLKNIFFWRAQNQFSIEYENMIRCYLCGFPDSLFELLHQEKISRDTLKKFIDDSRKCIGEDEYKYISKRLDQDDATFSAIWRKIKKWTGTNTYQYNLPKIPFGLNVARWQSVLSSKI